MSLSRAPATGIWCPIGHRVSGWRVGADGRSLTAFIPEQFTAGLVESLQDNGEFALTVEEFPSHETYQFKGRYLRHRPRAARRHRNRRPHSRAIREEHAGRCSRDGPEASLRAFVSKPALAVEFEVLEIYVQTPGPGAGTRLVPPADA